MRMSSGVEWALHACGLLAVTPAGQVLQTARLAEFHEIPPAYLAKHLQALARAGIVEAVYGPSGGYRLARPADAISLLEIVLAVDGDERAFACTEIRRNGPCGMRATRAPSPCTYAAVMWEAEDAWRAHLAARTLADVTARMLRTVDPEERRRGRAWLGEHARGGTA